MKRTIFNPRGTSPDSDIVGYKLLDNNTLELRVNTGNYQLLQRLSVMNYGGYSFKTADTRKAYIKAYYLYELLVQDFGFSRLFNVDWFRKSIGETSEGVSSEVLETINKRFHVDGILYIETSNYRRSVKKRFRGKQGNRTVYLQRYEYVPFSFMNNSFLFSCAPNYFPQKCSHTKATSILFNLHPSIFKLVKLYDDIKCSSSIDAVIEILQHFYERNKENLDQSLCPQDLFQVSNEIYIAPYEFLSLSITAKDVLRIKKWETLLTWYKYRGCPAKITNTTRLWHPFHSLAREYRKHLTYEGALLIEAMDVSNCFYVLLLKILETSQSIDPGELCHYTHIVRSGLFYEEAMPYVRLDPELIYKDESVRDITKTKLQRYRNLSKETALRYVEPAVDFFFRSNYPSIREFLIHYPVREDGVKQLQSDMCKVETIIISRVCFRLKDQKVTPFSLHDGIYLSEKDMEKLKEYRGLKDINETKSYINTIFWEEFDKVNTQDIITLLSPVVSQE